MVETGCGGIKSHIVDPGNFGPVDVDAKSRVEEGGCDIGAVGACAGRILEVVYFGAAVVDVCEEACGAEKGRVAHYVVLAGDLRRVVMAV